MDTTLGYFLDYADADFDGASFNGDSLMATLRRLGSADAASKATLEGYSAASVAVHVAWCKHVLARSLGGEEAAGAFPFPVDKYGFAPDWKAEEDAWKALLAYLPKIHRIVAELFRGLGPGRLAETMPEWKIPYGQVLAWYLGHDGYHTAQIRNMGTPGLK